MFSDRSEEESSDKFPSLKQAVSERMVSRFPVKLWRITNECKTGAIAWHKKGRSIRINKTDFEKQYLGNPLSTKDEEGSIASSRSSFKTKHFRSFVRQLNMYGFRKISHSRNMKISKICCPSNNRSFPLGHSYSQMNAFHSCLLEPHHSNMTIENNTHEQENIYTDNDNVNTELQDVNGRSAVIYEYCHPFFQQDHPELLFQIQRPKKKHLDTENLLALAQCAIEDSLLSGNSWEPLQGIRLMSGKESGIPEEQNQTTIPQLLNTEPQTVNITHPEPVSTPNIYPQVPVSVHDVNVIQDAWSEQTVRILASSGDDSASIMAPSVCSGYVSPNFNKEVWLSSLPMDHSKASYLISTSPAIDGDQAFLSGKDSTKSRFCYEQFYQSPVDVSQVSTTLNTGTEILATCPEQDVTPNSLWKTNAESIQPLYNNVTNHFKHTSLLPEQPTYSDVPQCITTNINSNDGNNADHCSSQVWLLP